MDIDEAISSFCKYNDIDLDNSYTIRSERKYLSDFKDNVIKWADGFPDEETKNALLSILSKYEYVSVPKFQDRMEEIFNEVMDFLSNNSSINEKYGSIDIDEILFITVESKYVSGSQEILSSFRYINQTVKQRNIVAEYDKALEEESFLNSYKAVVLIDDVIGSGWTITVNAIETALKIINHTVVPPVLLVCSAYCKGSHKKKNLQKV